MFSLYVITYVNAPLLLCSADVPGAQNKDNNNNNWFTASLKPLRYLLIEVMLDCFIETMV